MIEELLADEVRRLPGAVWQPLGDKPLAALKHLASKGVLNSRQIAPVLPHPSGANAERVAFFLGRKSAEALSAKTNAASISELRRALTAFYSERAGGRA
jgi:hypothetical protein